MSTAAQIAANIANAQASSGPRSDTGKAITSKNSVVFGLFSGDFVRPGEEQGYAALHVTLVRELAPIGALEDVLVEEVQRAMWRLRRCGEVESHLVLRLSDGENFILDAMEALNSPAEKIQRSVDRARSQAHRLLHKSTAELRRLQADRRCPAVAKPAQQETPEVSETPVAKQTQSEPVETPEIPRGAQCPCGSGQKYKRCCGVGAPAMLHAA